MTTNQRASDALAASRHEQHLQDLEAATNTATRRIIELEAEVRTLNTDLQREQHDHDATRRERDRLKEQVVRTGTKAGLIGKALLDLISDTAEISDTYAPKNNGAQRAVARALSPETPSGDDGKPAPDFLTTRGTHTSGDSTP